MYYKITMRDVIRIPPKFFSESLEHSIMKSLREEYEGKVDKELGVIITITDPRDYGEGVIIPGDGAAYHRVTFDAIVFKPELHELVRGKIVDLTEYGAFVRFGPIDGFIHKSQITDDYVSYNEKTGAFVGNQTKRVLKKEDKVLARIVAISLKENVQDSKINLTMRQPYLGKEEWWEEKEKKKGGK